MTFEEHIWNKWSRLSGHRLQKECFKQTQEENEETPETEGTSGMDEGNKEQ